MGAPTWPQAASKAGAVTNVRLAARRVCIQPSWRENPTSLASRPPWLDNQRQANQHDMTIQNGSKGDLKRRIRLVPIVSREGLKALRQES
jgi:hypothetical protein